MKLFKFFFICILLTMITNIMAAQPILYATVRNDKSNDNGEYTNSFTYKESSIQFPIERYSYTIFAYDLKFTSDEQKNQVILDKHHTTDEFKLDINADLRLIAFDKSTGIYKFKLTLDHPSLNFIGSQDLTGPLIMTGGYILKDKIKLANGSDPIFFIEGKYEEKNGIPILTSFNKNKYFDIQIDDFDLAVSKRILLKRISDFPVMIASQ